MSLLLCSGLGSWDCPSMATESVKESSKMTPDELLGVFMASLCGRNQSRYAFTELTEPVTQQRR